MSRSGSSEGADSRFSYPCELSNFMKIPSLPVCALQGSRAKFRVDGDLHFKVMLVKGSPGKNYKPNAQCHYSVTN